VRSLSRKSARTDPEGREEAICLSCSSVRQKHPGYDAINRLIKVRDDFTWPIPPSLATPMLLAISAG